MHFMRRLPVKGGFCKRKLQESGSSHPGDHCRTSRIGAFRLYLFTADEPVGTTSHPPGCRCVDVRASVRPQ